MTYLEAQNRDPTRPDTGVSFTKTVWPLLISRGSEIDAFLFGARKRIPHLSPDGVERLGRLAALDRETQEKVRHFSYYGGNMNVVFRAASRGPIEALVAPWPLLQTKDDEDFLPPSWTPRETKAFLSLVMDSPVGGASFCFGHDGDPLFVFANSELIRSLALRGTGQALDAILPDEPGRRR